VLDANGKALKAYGSFGTLASWRNAPQFNHPSGVFVHPSGNIYVADTLNQRVVVLDKDGLVLSTFGTQGKDNGQFNLPRFITMDHFGKIWVLDSGNSRVQVFSGLGVFNATWGAFGTDPGLLNQPLGLALNNIDQTILDDTGNFRIQVFNDQTAPVTEGSPTPVATGPVTPQGWYG